MQDCAIARCRIGHVIGSGDPKAAGHVSHDDDWVAGNEAGQIARHHAGADVVIATGRGWDDHLHRLAAIEILHSVSMPGRRCGQQGCGEGEGERSRPCA